MHTLSIGFICMVCDPLISDIEDVITNRYVDTIQSNAPIESVTYSLMIQFLELVCNILNIISIDKTLINKRPCHNILNFNINNLYTYKGKLIPRTSNHKRIGCYYMICALIFGISGINMSLLIRLECDSSGNRIIISENINSYNLYITLHGLIMIFFFIMPILYGAFANIFIPLYLGTSEVTYPRINNLSILLIPLSYCLIMLSINSEFTIGTGWTLYPPLSISNNCIGIGIGIGIDLIIYGLLLSGISSTLTSLNLFNTLHIMKAIGCTLSYLLIYIWSIGITAYMLLLILPILTGALIMLFTDIHYNTMFYDPLFGGDPIFYQHLFWFFGHPEVYILILPAFGLISIILLGLLQ